MSRVLITGASGFLGRTLASVLVADGHEVTALSRRDYASPGVRSITVDITDQERMRATTFDGHFIIHAAAARARPEDGWEGVTHTIRVNALGTLHMLELAQRCGIPRLIYCSSSSIYALPQPLPINEDGRTYPAPGPDSIYGASKLMGELLCQRIAGQAGLRCLCLRFGRLYGPGEPSGRVLADWVALATTGRELIVHGNGERSADFLCMMDAVRAIRLALQRGWEGGTLNVGTGRETTWRELAETVADVFSPPGRRAPIRYVSEGSLTRCALNVSRVREVLGFHAAVSLRAGLEAWREAIGAPVEISR